MNKTIIAVLLVSSLTMNVFAYDEALAATLDKSFSKVTQKNIIKSKSKINAKDLFKMISEKKQFVILDIRTKAETSILGLKTDNTLEIPLENLFKKKNLDRLPTKEPIVLVCHSGSRTKMAVMNLKMLGFKNILVLKEGIVGIAKMGGAKNVPVK